MPFKAAAVKSHKGPDRQISATAVDTACRVTQSAIAPTESYSRQTAG